MTKRGGGKEMFYPLRMEARLAGRRAADLFNRRQWIVIISPLRSCVSWMRVLTPSECAFGCHCHVCASVCVSPKGTDEPVKEASRLFHCSHHRIDQVFFVFTSKLTKSVSRFRRIWTREVDAHQFSLLDWPVLQRLSWTLPADQEDGAGEDNAKVVLPSCSFNKN